jgi:methyl-accepting chemotaxis protein
MQRVCCKKHEVRKGLKFPGEDEQSAADQALHRKKQQTYILLFLTVMSTMVLVAGFSTYILNLRKTEGQVFLKIAAQRSESQLIMLRLFSAETDQWAKSDIDDQIHQWKQAHILLFEELKQKVRTEEDRVFIGEQVEALIGVTQKLEALIQSVQQPSAYVDIYPELSKLQEEYLIRLNSLSSSVLSISEQNLSRYIFLVATLLMLALVVFVLLFAFQVRPLFNQILVVNRELRSISLKQSHIIRAPVANILGLLFLAESTKSVEEMQEYMRLIRLNAEAIDERIHQIVQASEQLQDFDGRSSKLTQQIVLSEEDVQMDDAPRKAD